MEELVNHQDSDSETFYGERRDSGSTSTVLQVLVLLILLVMPVGVQIIGGDSVIHC